MPTTCSPRASSRSQTCIPIKPAAPVTITGRKVVTSLFRACNARPGHERQGLASCDNHQSGAPCKRIQMCRKHDGAMHCRMLSAHEDLRTIAPHVLHVVDGIFGANA